MSIQGLKYVPNFLSEIEQQDALRAVDSQLWRTDLKRRTQHYGYVYDYKKRRIDTSMYLGPLPEFVMKIALKLGLDEVPDQLIVNEYIPGQGIAAHIDCVPCFNGIISTISLGHAYEMDFVNLKTKKKHSLILEVGSLAVISEEARYDWTHQIQARNHDNGIPRGRRVSLTFRKVII